MLGATAINPVATHNRGDDSKSYFGPAFIQWQTDDANANVLAIILPEGGAVDVPVLVIGDTTAERDLGVFNATTQPHIMVIDADGDSGIGLGFAADDTPRLWFTGSAAGLKMGGQFLEFSERAAPGAGNADTARVYAIANGALTTLQAVFQDSSTDTFATESTDPDSPLFEFPDGTEVKMVIRKPNRQTLQLTSVFPDGREHIWREKTWPEPKW